MQYAVAIHLLEVGCLAVVPDLPGCRFAGETLAEVRAGVQRAIREHCASLLARGLRMPDARPFAEWTGIADFVPCEWLEVRVEAGIAPRVAAAA